MTKVVGKVEYSIFAWLQFLPEDPDADKKTKDIIDQMIQMYYDTYGDVIEGFE